MRIWNPGKNESLMNIIETLRSQHIYEDEALYLRLIIETDKEEYFELPGNLGETVLNALWKNALFSENSITFAAVEKRTGKMIGTGSVNNRTENCLELGYEVLESKQGRGFGTQILLGLIRMARPYSDVKKIIARVRADNSASIHIIEKAGGVKTAEEPSWYEELVAKDGEEFWSKHSERLDHVRTLVYEFRTNQEEKGVDLRE